MTSNSLYLNQEVIYGHNNLIVGSNNYIINSPYDQSIRGINISGSILYGNNNIIIGTGNQENEYTPPALHRSSRIAEGTSNMYRTTYMDSYGSFWESRNNHRSSNYDSMYHSRIRDHNPEPDSIPYVFQDEFSDTESLSNYSDTEYQPLIPRIEIEFKGEDTETEIETLQCDVCKQNKKSVAYGCGHLTCRMCSQRLSDCPVCRAGITSRLEVFI